ncbi:hypothetical protein DMC47_10340 [Nostoc sp. 3335mG]|nr:hypothetical protein DMC47_10340 [Nostoc sp. 3335mG]
MWETNMHNILDTWRERRSVRRTRQQLYGLSDHVLHDIGLTRADVASLGSAWTPLRRPGSGR